MIKRVKLTNRVLGTLLTCLSIFAHAETLDRTVMSAGSDSIAVGDNLLSYTIGQPFATAYSEPVHIGFWSPVETEEVIIDPPEPPECEEEIAFTELKAVYQVGETVDLSLNACYKAESSYHRVDLWVVLQMPNGSFFYKTDLAVFGFSPSQKAFQTSLESIETSYHILQVGVPPGLGGNYTLYAAFIEEGKNPMTDGMTVIRSKLAVASTVLSNE